MEGAPVRVLADARTVGVALSPIRQRILESLVEPDSASGLAQRMGLARQKVNYHLRELERGGLLELVEERQRRGFVERRLKVTARAFMVDPSLLGGLAADPQRLRDRFSSAYLLAVAAKLIRDVSGLRDRAAKAGKKLLTQTLETEVSFASPADYQSFTEELTAEIARLATKYAAGARGERRRFRLVLATHPLTGGTNGVTSNDEPKSEERGRT